MSITSPEMYAAKRTKFVQKWRKLRPVLPPVLLKVLLVVGLDSLKSFPSHGCRCKESVSRREYVFFLKTTEISEEFNSGDATVQYLITRHECLVWWKC